MLCRWTSKLGSCNYSLLDDKMKGNKRKVIKVQFSVLASYQPNPGNKYICQIYISYFLKHESGP
jgi:hypothetical protein